MLHGAEAGEAQFLAEPGEMQALAPILRRRFFRRSYGREELYAEFHAPFPCLFTFSHRAGGAAFT